MKIPYIPCRSFSHFHLQFRKRILFRSKSIRNAFTINALTAADKVIVVVSPGYFELDSVIQISKTIQEVKEYFNPSLELQGFLFTMSDPTINSATSLDILRQAYPTQLLQTVIPRNTDLRDAHFSQQDIFAYNPHAKAALAYSKLIEELFGL